MKKNARNAMMAVAAISALTFASCLFTDDNESSKVVLQNHTTGNESSYLKLTDDFSDVKVYTLLTSTSELDSSPNFVYGSMADGAGLLKNFDGTYSLINNIEADYSIARITFDETFKPVKGEHIVNGDATANTAQCSGSLITQEEHGFGPIYLSGGEWGGSSKGVFSTNPDKSASQAGSATMLSSLGQWSTENAVAIGKDAYPSKTVVFIGDDHSDNEIPSGHLGMYVGDRGDLTGGNLYVLKVTSSGITYEMDMEEGQEYDISFVEMDETEIDALDAEAKAAGAMGFSRLEDIDWRRGSAANNREIYMAVTGRKKDGLTDKGTFYGRIYKVTLNENDPTGAGKIEVVLDGDKVNGKAWGFHSPDNILVTTNYAYIQEDPNGYQEDGDARDHYARLYQYNLNTKELKVVLEADQVKATANNVGTEEKMWELTGMIDVSDIINQENSYLLITQNHGWTQGGPYTDPLARPGVELDSTRAEGSMLFLVQGLAR